MRKMISTGSPKPLWDHCLELEALVRSCTCNDIYMTAGQVPETIMTGSTADISHIAEFGWYDWVMYRDNVPSYPDDRLILGRYLGPATDIGSALTAKILQPNGQFVCRWTLRHLTDEELQSSVRLDKNTSSMSLSQLILDRLQRFMISLPKTLHQMTLTTLTAPISLTLITVMLRSCPKWVTIISVLRSCFPMVAQWSK